MPAIYLDTSAAAKLFQQEAESDALQDWLTHQGDAPVLTCDLTRTELRRALLAAQPDPDTAQACDSWLTDCAAIRLTSNLCDRAGVLQVGTRLRSLDALHLAAALSLGPALSAFVAYDARLRDAARRAGLPVVAPGARGPSSHAYDDPSGDDRDLDAGDDELGADGPDEKPSAAPAEEHGTT